MPPTTVNATLGTVTVTAVTPAFAMMGWKRTLVSAGSGTVTVTGFAASIIAPVIAATLGMVTVTAYPAEIHQSRIDVLCNTGTVTVTGYNVNPALITGVLVNATLGQVTVTGFDAISTLPTVVKVTQAGAVTVTGYDTIVNSTAVWASLGQVLVTGYNPAVVAPLVPGFGVGPAPSTSKNYITYYQDWATHFPAEIARRWRQFLLDTFYIATPPVTAGGTANSIELTTDAEITQLTVGQAVRFTALYDNTGGTVLDVNNIGPQYVRYEGEPLKGGEIVAGGIYTVVYDGFYWNLAAASSGAASEWLDTTNFDGILSAADNDVQKAMDTIDDLAYSAPGHTHVFGDLINRLEIAVKNTTGSLIVAGSVCYISGDSSGTPLITLADASAESSASKMLVLTSEGINDNGTGNAIVYGRLYGLSGFTASAVQYLSTTSGGMTETAPSGVGEIVRIVGYAMTTSSVFFNPDDSFSIVDDEAMREFALADAQPNKYLSYVGGVLDLIEIYDATPTKLYEKQFNYTGGVLDEIVLTRMSDSATWTKTLTYAGGVLEEIEVA